MENLSRRGFLSGFVAVAATLAAGPALALAPGAPKPLDFIKHVTGLKPGRATFSAYVKIARGEWHRVSAPIEIARDGTATLSLRRLGQATPFDGQGGYLEVHPERGHTHISAALDFSDGPLVGVTRYDFGDMIASFAAIQLESQIAIDDFLVQRGTSPKLIQPVDPAGEITWSNSDRLFGSKSLLGGEPGLAIDFTRDLVTHGAAISNKGWVPT